MNLAKIMYLLNNNAKMNPGLSDSKGCGHNHYIIPEGRPTNSSAGTFKAALDALPSPYSGIHKAPPHYDRVPRFP